MKSDAKQVAPSKPAASATGYGGEKSSFGASRDVSPVVAEGAVSVAASDIPVVDVGHVLSSPLPMPHT